MRTKYTNEDIEFLKTYYPTGDWDMIFKRFPHLDKEKIYNVCHKRGISANYYNRDKDLKSQYYENMVKNRKVWTDDEIEILKNNYSIMSVEDIMNLLPGRTYNAIIEKTKKLSLTSYIRQQQLYSEEDIDFIKSNWKYMSDEEMAQSLHRTRRAIKAVRNGLELFRQDKEKCHYEDIIKFLRGQIHRWKKHSVENCNYQCILTKSKDFEIHHVVSFNIIVKNFISEYSPVLKDKFEDYTTNELQEIADEFVNYHDTYPLGICLDKKLHELFHSTYGDINDEKQLNIFIQNFNEGNILH